MRGPSQCVSGHGRREHVQRVGVGLLALDRAAGDDEVGVGDPLEHARERVEQDVEALPGVDAPGGTHERRVVGDPGPGPEGPGSARGELVGVDRLVDHDDGRCLGSWSAMACDIAITRVAKCSVRICSTRSAAARLHGDLAGVPHVRAPGERCRRPAVPRVQRVGVHEVDLQRSDQLGEAADRDRPPDAVAGPGVRGRATWRSAPSARCAPRRRSPRTRPAAADRREPRRGTRTRRLAGCGAT